MLFKNFFGNIFGFNEEIEVLNRANYNLRQDVLKLLRNLETESIRNKQLKLNLIECSTKQDYYKKITRRLQAHTKPTNIPSANITYIRPILIGKNKWIQSKIDVRNFIMPDFTMEEKLKKKKLIFKVQKYKPEKLDSLIPKIYHLAKNNYRYGPDYNFGFNEFWMFPYELEKILEKGKAGDCDDWANLIGSYFAAAKIPRNRWLISAGTTRSGYGHATVYAKDSKGIWRHLNSTSPTYRDNDLTKFPSNKDDEDKIGIKPGRFWFSYNDFFSIHKFETAQASISFRKEKLPIQIEKRG